MSTRLDPRGVAAARLRTDSAGFGGLLPPVRAPLRPKGRARDPQPGAPGVAGRLQKPTGGVRVTVAAPVQETAR